MGWSDTFVANSPDKPSSWSDAFTQPSADATPQAGAPGFWGQTAIDATNPKEWLRQIELFGRHAVTAATALPAVIGNGLNTAANLGIDGVNAVAGTNIAPLQMPTQMVQRAENAVGLPQPKNMTERLVGDATASGLSVAPNVALGTALSKFSDPVIRTIGNSFKMTPGNQMVAATTAGTAAGGAREAGLGDGWQLGAGLVGGLAGAVGAGTLVRPVRWMGAQVAPGATESIAPGSIPQSSPSLAASAVDSNMGGQPAALVPNPAEAQSLAQRTAAALEQNPGTDPAAAARMADFRSLGMIGENGGPTLGQLGRDPAQFSLEQNMRSQSKPLLGRFNTQMTTLNKILSNITGTAQEAFPAGNTIGTQLQAIDDALRAKVTAAYQAARSSAGASGEIDMTGLAQDYANILRDHPDQIPEGIKNRFNDYGLLDGTQRKTFNYNDAEDLLKLINSNDGPMIDPGVGTALDKLRAAVKDSVVNGGTEGDPFAAARQMAAQRFTLHDQVPALDAVASGKFGSIGNSTWSPESLVRNYVTGGDVTGLNNLVGLLKSTKSTGALGEVRAQLGNELQKSGFGFNPSGDAPFTPGRYANALTRLGTDRLSAAFSPDEIANLQAAGRVGGYITQQPSGGFVNRSNTGATMLDLGKELPFGIGKAVNALSNRAAIAKALEADLGNIQQPFLTGGMGSPAANVFNAGQVQTRSPE